MENGGTKIFVRTSYNKGMITQFNKRTSRRHNKSSWPKSPDYNVPIFYSRKPHRRLVVMIDHELSSKLDPDNTLSKELLLQGLLNSKLLIVHKYTDETPKDVNPAEETYNKNQKPVYPGYIMLHPYEATDRGIWPVTYYQDGAHHFGFVMGNAPSIAKDDESQPVYRELDLAERSIRREKDQLALETADQCLHADIYITERPYLLSESKLTDRAGVTICTPDEAITAVGLYLRSQNEYVIPITDRAIQYSFDRSLFYWVGVRGLLHEGWRWHSACVRHSHGVKDDKLLVLGGTVLTRVQRAIEYRDSVHVALNQDGKHSSNEDALSNLDGVLMSLMGALDSAARVLHYVLELDPDDEYNAAWQKKKWLNKVGKECPEISNIFNGKSKHWHTLNILRLLRNSIHGQALRGVTLLSGQTKQLLMQLPVKDQEDIIKSMESTGGAESWGLRSLNMGRNDVRPNVLVDKIVEQTINLLNIIMKQTPVESLQYFDYGSKVDKSNRKNDTMDPFNDWNSKAIIWQLGLKP